jgi:hypothetical protein
VRVWYLGIPYGSNPTYRFNYENEEMKRDWRTVAGYDGRYTVSNMGDVRSGNRLLKQFTIGEGYWGVGLSWMGVTKIIRVHVLVLEAFISEKPKGKECNHKDGNKKNNRLENLEWVTRSQNVKHAYDTKLIIPARGERYGRSNLTEADIKTIRKCRASGSRITDLARRFGVTPPSCWAIINYKSWKWVR